MALVLTSGLVVSPAPIPTSPSRPLLSDTNARQARGLAAVTRRDHGWRADDAMLCSVFARRFAALIYMRVAKLRTAVSSEGTSARSRNRREVPEIAKYLGKCESPPAHELHP